MKNKQIYLGLILLCLLAGLNKCSGIHCKCPDFIQQNINRFESVSQRLLSVKDSIAEKIHGVYRLSSDRRTYELVDHPDGRSVKTPDPLSKELSELKVVRFSIEGNNVKFCYYYKSDFFAGEIIYKLLIFENERMGFSPEEGELSWKLKCDEMISSRLRHVIIVETL